MQVCHRPTEQTRLQEQCTGTARSRIHLDTGKSASFVKGAACKICASVTPLSLSMLPDAGICAPYCCLHNLTWASLICCRWRSLR